mmetsp:Transcript_80242/g.240350  ORF Transcript_80242/g.240350 Transcript_80242/m.240350 type:complete len:273 (-) Transcript_80242:481-1299(-)
MSRLPTLIPSRGRRRWPCGPTRRPSSAATTPTTRSPKTSSRSRAASRPPATRRASQVPSSPPTSWSTTIRRASARPRLEARGRPHALRSARAPARRTVAATQRTTPRRRRSGRSTTCRAPSSARWSSLECRERMPRFAPNMRRRASSRCGALSGRPTTTLRCRAAGCASRRRATLASMGRPGRHRRRAPSFRRCRRRAGWQSICDRAPRVAWCWRSTTLLAALAFSRPCCSSEAARWSRAMRSNSTTTSDQEASIGRSGSTAKRCAASTPQS